MVTPSFVTKNRIYRSSCNGVEIRLVQMPDLAYLTISGRGQDQRVEIAEQDVAAMVNEFQAIGEDPIFLIFPRTHSRLAKLV
jgi:hypothetical protein